MFPLLVNMLYVTEHLYVGVYFIKLVLIAIRFIGPCSISPSTCNISLVSVLNPSYINGSYVIDIIVLAHKLYMYHKSLIYMLYAYRPSAYMPHAL